MNEGWKPWTNKEEKILRQMWYDLNFSKEDFLAELPNRRWSSIKHRAYHKMKLGPRYDRQHKRLEWLKSIREKVYDIRKQLTSK